MSNPSAHYRYNLKLIFKGITLPNIKCFNQSLFQRLFNSSSCKSLQIEYAIIESKQFARRWCYAATRRSTGYGGRCGERYLIFIIYEFLNVNKDLIWCKMVLVFTCFDEMCEFMKNNDSKNCV